jgi:(R,R)-butanediol dehydrogenase/meso-butanediol dehydrogenase/diacetyl reductase
VHPDDASDQVRDLVPNGADVVIESSGVPGAAQRAVRLVSSGGSVLLVGLVKAPQSLDTTDLVLREVTMNTTVAHVCDDDLPLALDLLDRRPLTALLVDRIVSLIRVVPDAFQPLASTGLPGKVLVTPAGS